MVTDLMTLMLTYYTFGANIGLTVLAEVFGLLLWMFDAEFVHEALFPLFLMLPTSQPSIRL